MSLIKSLLFTLLLAAAAVQASTRDEIERLWNPQGMAVQPAQPAAGTSARTEKPASRWFRLSNGRQVNLADWKVVLFMQGHCPYCHQFDPVLKQLAQQYGFSVFPYTLDGQGDTAFPEALPVPPDVMQTFFPNIPVANVTQHNGEWKTLSSDKVGKTGFIENVYANQIAFGRLYREKLKEQVEALGYETEVVGKHGMWEMPGVPVEAFSGRSQAIREAVGEDASLKSRDVAALDTRKSKQHVDPEIKMVGWMQTLKETGFDIRAYRDAADQRAETRTQTPGPASQDGPDVQQAVTQAIAGLSERKVQFTYTDVLARTVGILPPENGVIERARAGIDEAISREQLIPLDREKGLFTSGIHALDELSVRALSRDIMKQNRVTIHPEKSVPRTAGYSDAVSVLAQDRPSLAIVSGQGGAAGQRERVAELVMMAREQGREVQIIAADRRSQMNLKQDERLSGELITGRRQLLEGMAFTPGSTVIVDQGEKLSLKETLTLLDGAARHNVQVLITDSGQRTGTGSALMAMKDAGVNTYRWQGGEGKSMRR